MRVFLDTNVIVSAVATRGLCADVLREVLIRHQLVVSDPLLDELKKVLLRKIGLPQEMVFELIEMFQNDSHVGVATDLPDIDIQDKDDPVILSSALNGGADLFVTGDKELQDLKKIRSMKIVTPRTFWKILQK